MRSIAPVTVLRASFGGRFLRMMERWSMSEISLLEKFTVPLGGQEIELQQIVHANGAMPMLRVRIREGKRFTIFDLDPLTAGKLGEAMCLWSGAQAKGEHG